MLVFLSPNITDATTILSEDFNSGIPATWSVVDAEGNGVVWTDLAGTGDSNYTGGSGDAATVNSDNFFNTEFDTSLISPSFSLVGLSFAHLSYLANYQNLAGLDFLDVDITTNSGAIWTNLLSWNEDHGGFFSTPGELVNIDLSAYIGESDVQLRWRYYDPNTGDWDWYAQIDNVSVVPEPSTMLLLGGGLLGLIFFRKKFRK
jgi:hypothetical protein